MDIVRVIWAGRTKEKTIDITCGQRSSGSIKERKIKETTPVIAESI